MINTNNNQLYIPLFQYLAFLQSKLTGTAQKQKNQKAAVLEGHGKKLVKYVIAMKIYVMLELGAQMYPTYYWGLRLDFKLYYISQLFDQIYLTNGTVRESHFRNPTPFNILKELWLP